MWSNFHTHTNYCDGSSSIEDVADFAKGKLISLGISSHAPVPFDCAWCMNNQDIFAYFKAIEQQKLHIKNEIEIYSGLEVDFIPNITGPAAFNDLVDYTIGSIHFIDTLPDGSPWEIDGAHHKFLTGFNQLFGADIKSVIGRYYQLTRQMIEESTPDVVGHLDKIKIQNLQNSLFSETEDWYMAEINETLACIQAAGVVVEVNTRGLYQKKAISTYPSRWVIELMYAMHIPITLSSDAHQPVDLINQFSETAEMLNTVGYTEMQILLGGAWQAASFNKNGIIL